MQYDPDRHHRQSIRLDGRDYAEAGAYFVTCCTFQRECLFGEVIEDMVQLTEAGAIVQQEWRDLSKRFPSLGLDAFVVMPNHIHGILVMRRDIREGLKVSTLGQILRAYKSVTAISINRLLGRGERPLWQRNYYEKVIRDQGMFEMARAYIVHNPSRWEQDADNPINLPVPIV